MDHSWVKTRTTVFMAGFSFREGEVALGREIGSSGNILDACILFGDDLCNINVVSVEEWLYWNDVSVCTVFFFFF